MHENYYQVEIEAESGGGHESLSSFVFFYPSPAWIYRIQNLGRGCVVRWLIARLTGRKTLLHWHHWQHGESGVCVGAPDGVLGKALLGQSNRGAYWLLLGCRGLPLAATGRCPMQARPWKRRRCAVPSAAITPKGPLYPVSAPLAPLHSMLHVPCPPPLQAHGTRIHENSPIANGPSHVGVSPIRAVFWSMDCFSVESSPVLRARSTKPNNQGQRERGPRKESISPLLLKSPQFPLQALVLVCLTKRLPNVHEFKRPAPPLPPNPPNRPALKKNAPICSIFRRLLWICTTPTH